MRKVYFISGLGADERAFKAMDLSFCEPVFLPWLKPSADDTLESYAARMFAATGELHPVIVGLSFGGMVATEIARQFNPEKVVIISSAKSRCELPPWLRLLRYFPLHRMLKAQRIKQLNAFAYRVLGVAHRSDKILFRKMLQQSDDWIFDWSINAVVNWKNRKAPANVIHIHGKNDILLPAFFVKADFWVEDGRHLMPMIQPGVVSAIVKRVLGDG